MQIHVGQKRTDHGPLRRPSLRGPLSHPLHHPLPQVGLDQPQQAAIRDMPPHFRHQLWMGDRVEVALDVGVHHPGIPLRQEPLDLPQRILASTARTEPVATRVKLPLEDRLHHHAQCALHHSVPHRRDPQRSLLHTPRLLDPAPPYRLRYVGAGAQCLAQVLEVLLGLGLKLPHRLPIHSPGSLASFHLVPCGLQRPGGVHLIDQAEPYSSFHPLLEGAQHALGPHRGFHPRPPGVDLSGLLSPFGHLHRFAFPRRLPHAVTSLRPFAPRPLQALRRYYDRSDS